MVFLLMLRNRKFFQGTVMLIFIRKHTQELLLIDLYSMKLSNNTEEGIKIVKNLFLKKCSVHVLNVGLLEDTAMGQFFITTLLAVAELERNQIIERCQTGKAIARQNPDFTEGRPKKYSQQQVQHALDLLESHSYKQVEQMTGISKSTLIRAKKALK